MAISVTIDCSGERHTLRLTDDGRIHVDPDKHDVALERTLADLGAELPQCIEGADTFTADPTALILDLPDVMEQYGALQRQATRYYLLLSIQARWQRDASWNLCADALEHVMPYTKEGSKARNTTSDIIDVTREVLRAENDDDLHLSIKSLAKTATSIAGGLQSHPPRHTQKPAAVYVLSAAAKLAKMVYHRHTTIYDTRVLELCRTAAVAHANPCVDTPHLSFEECVDLEAVYANREKQWQAGCLVRGITAMLEWKPWPSL
jgi:hypothetical protein